MKIAQGTVVSLHYSLSDQDGTFFDSTEGREPLSYLHGYGNIIPGLERELEGAEPGYTGRITVPPEEAYGERNPEAVFEVGNEQLPPDFEPKPGMVVQAQTPEGVVQVTVDEVTDSGVVLDANHPLAGKTLNFDVEVADVREATEEEKQHGHVHE